MVENKRIQIRRDIALNWSTKNPILLQGEVGFDMTNNNIKIGDGVTPWNELAYLTTDVDLSAYYTKEQVDDLIERIELPEDVLEQYYTKKETEEYVKSEIAKIDIPDVPEDVDLSNYYTKGETEEYVKSEIEKIEIPDVPEIPDIPTVGAGNVTIRQGVSSHSFNVNQAEDVEIVLPTGDEGNHWYGTQLQFDKLETYDESVTYHISDIDYSEISNTPTVPIKISDLTNNIGYTTTEKVGMLIDEKQWFGTQEEFDALESYDPTVTYNVEVTEGGGGESVDLSNYYNKEETDNAIDTKLSGYYTEEEIDNLLEVNIPDTTEFITRTESESVIAEQVQTQVNEKIDSKLWFGTQEQYNTLEEKLEGVTYYVEAENQAVYDLDNYYTKEEIDAMLANLKG